jgi:hypothetical protein
MAYAASATISGRRQARVMASPPSRLRTAAVSMAVSGQREFTAMPSWRNSSAMARVHRLMPNFAMV